MGILSSIYGVIVMFPIVGYIIAFIIAKVIIRNHKKSVLIAVDITTFIMLLSVHHLVKVVFNQSFLGMIILILLVIAAVFVLYIYKAKGEIELDKVFKSIWRIYFILFVIAYIVLMIIGIYKNISLNIAL